MLKKEVSLSLGKINKKVYTPEKHMALDIIKIVDLGYPYTSGSRVGCIKKIGDYLYIAPFSTNGAPLQRVDLRTYAVEDSDVFPNNSFLGGLEADDTHIYLIDKSKIYKIDIVTFTKTAEVSHNCGYENMHITLSDTKVFASGYYIAFYQKQNKIVSVDKATFSVVEDFYLASSSNEAVVNNGYLYYRDYADFYKYNLTTELEEASHNYYPEMTMRPEDGGMLISDKYIIVPDGESDALVFLNKEDLSLVKVASVLPIANNMVFDAAGGKDVIGNFAYFSSISNDVIIRVNTQDFTVDLIGFVPTDPAAAMILVDNKETLVSVKSDGTLYFRYPRAIIPDFDSDYIVEDTSDMYSKNARALSGDRVIVDLVTYTSINTILNNPDDFMLTTPAYIDALTSYDGVGAGVTLLIWSEAGSPYSGDGTFATMTELSNAGVIDYTDIKDPITFRLKDALEYDAGLFYGYLSTIPEADWDKELKFTISIALGSSFATLTETEAINLYLGSDDCNLPYYVLVSNPDFGLAPKIPGTYEGDIALLEKRGE